MNFLSRGQFLGIALAGLTHPTYPATLLALEDSVVSSFSRDYFLKKLLPLEPVRNIVNQQIGERFLELQNDRCNESLLCPQKLADVLFRLWQKQGSTDQTIHIPLSRKDLAERIGTQPETVTRILSTWTKRGLIHTQNRRIEIKNIEELMHLRCPFQKDLH